MYVSVQGKDPRLVQDALARILHAAHLQFPSGNRIGTVPVLLSAVGGVVDAPAPILPSPLLLSEQALQVVEGAKVFASSLFSNMASETQPLTVRLPTCLPPLLAFAINAGSRRSTHRRADVLPAVL